MQRRASVGPLDEAALRGRALRLLARRDYSVAELRSRLAPLAEAELVERVLARLLELELASDTRYAEAFVRQRAERYGGARLRRELLQRGIDGELAEQALAQPEAADELARARALWLRRFGLAPTDAREWARQARFLQARGFASDIIRTLLKEPFDESA